MNLNFLCCIGAELKNSTQQTTRMTQIYLYRAYESETVDDMLAPGFFDAAMGIIRKDDLLLLYGPNDEKARYVYARVAEVNRDGVIVEKIEINAKDVYVNTTDTQNLKANNLQDLIVEIDSLPKVVFTGSYNDLKNKPTKLSNFIDDTEENPIDRAKADSDGNVFQSTYARKSFNELLYLTRTATTTADMTVAKPALNANNFMTTTTTNTTINWSGTQKIVLTRTTETEITLDAYSAFNISLAYAVNRNAQIEVGARVLIDGQIVSTQQIVGLRDLQGNNNYDEVYYDTFAVFPDNILSPTTYPIGTVITIELFKKQTSAQSLTTRIYCGATQGGGDRYSLVRSNPYAVAIGTNQIQNGSITPQKLVGQPSFTGNAGKALAANQSGTGFTFVEIFDLSSTQTITGKKTFTQGVYAQGRTGMSLANSFSGSPTILAEATDANKNITVRLAAFYDGSNTTILRLLSINNGQERYLDFKVKEDGTVGVATGGATKYLPGTSDNSTNFATTEWVNNVLNQFDYVVSSQEPTKENGYTWYRLYKSGWVEQGGKTNNTADINIQITLPIEMSDTQYTIMITPLVPRGNLGGYTSGVANDIERTTTSFYITGVFAQASDNNSYWTVSGMSAQGAQNV